MLSLVAALLLVIVAIPTVQYYHKQAQRIGCASALDTAQRRIDDEYLLNNYSLTAEQAKEAVEAAMHGWDDICPAGGNMYIVKSSTGVPYDIVCGIHNKNLPQRTRLNAKNVLEQINDAVKKSQKDGVQYPESVTVTLNGKKLECLLVDDDTDIRWGTNSTSGYEGTVAFYSIKGHSSFGSNSGVKDGQVWYFCFADENHCANWNSIKGWTGDSYNGFKGSDQD